MPKILIADDVPFIRDLIEECLEELTAYGVEFLFAKNGREALDTIVRERPELVFLDVIMPGMNGFDVCRTVKIDLGITGIRIVMVTGHDMDKGYEAGADYCLSKPFTPGEILEAAVEMLESLSVPLSRN